MNSNRLLLRQAHRAASHIQIRALDDKEGRFQARVMHYDVIDDYETEFAPGLFYESLESRLPRVVWAHDWAEPLGRYIDYEDTNTHLDLIGEFDNFDDVPRARQAYAQLKSGTIDEFSVGFMPLDGEMVVRDGRDIFRFTRARLDEVSLVLSGAVPNTQLLALRNGEIPAVRSPMLTVSKDFAAQTLLDLHSGKLDLADALQQVKLNAVADEDPPENEETDDDEDDESGDGAEGDGASDSNDDDNGGDGDIDGDSDGDDGGTSEDEGSSEGELDETAVTDIEIDLDWDLSEIDAILDLQSS